MKEGRPSLTALYVALARAVATHDARLAHVCADPCAERLLPSPLKPLVLHATRPGSSRWLLSLLRASLGGMAEHMALRTHLIDAAVAEGVAHGARQLVIIGAGLDSRAHRLAALAECDVYEVDFPSTQALKRERAQALPVVARALHYVSCDFERTGLEAALRGAGFSTETATFWIWEGVTMYLTEAMVAASLATMARLSAPRSRLVATYLEPIPSELKAIAAIFLSVLSAVSEPIRSNYDVAAMTTMLRAHGFSPLSDVSPREIAAHYAIRFPMLGLGAPRERIVVAERRAEP